MENNIKLSDKVKEIEEKLDQFRKYDQLDPRK